MVDKVMRLNRFKSDNEQGQAMVEMVLVLPILILLVFGIIEFGNLYTKKLAIDNLARQSVRIAAVSEPAGDAALETTMEAKISGATVVISRSGSDVTATVNCSVELLTRTIINTESVNLLAVVTMMDE